MPRRFLIVTCILVASATVAGATYVVHRSAKEITAAAPPIEDVVATVLASRTREVMGDDAVPFGDDNVVNVLVLGIDSRKEGAEQHCDAIHMVSTDVRDWTVAITSVPRGTYTYIPGTYEPNEYYVANACAFAGLEYGIGQIERIVGVQADYVVTVGFSQALGTFRALGLPTTETLQWLRHRRSYQIGDPQRSRNQAVFMKDMVMKFAQADQPLSPTMLYVLYKFVETDMDFGTARALYDGVVASGIASRPDDVTLVMRPHYDTVDYHLDLEDPDAQLAPLLERIRPYTTKDDLSDRTLGDIQVELVAYLTDALGDDAEVAHVWSEATWRQVEDDATREELQYAFVERYARLLAASGEREAATNAVADYILEKQTLGVAAYEANGRDLLASIVVQ